MALFSERIALLIDANTGGATAPLGALERQAKQTDSAFDKMAKSVGLTGETLKTGLIAGAAALVGTNLVGYLTSSAAAYADAATAANQLSKATNASVEQASRFNAVAGAYGLGLNDLTEIFSDFQQSAQGSTKELALLGVQLTKNADGTTDWVSSAVDFLDVLQKIPDATERNRLLFKYFGEEGAKQLMSLVNSGRSVQEAMEAISTAQVFGTDDVAAAQDYNLAMQSLDGSLKGLSFTLGREVAPLVAAGAEALAAFVDVLGDVPIEVYLVAGAIVALNVALKSQLVASAANAGLAMLGMAQNMGVARAAMYTTAAASEALAATLAANPILVIGAAVLGGVYALSQYKEGLRGVVDEVNALVDAGEELDAALQKTAEAVVEQRGWLESLGAAVSGVFSWEGLKETLSFGGPSKGDVVDQAKRDLEGLVAAQDEAEESQSAYAKATEQSRTAQDGLNAVLADASSSQQAIADAVGEAGAAQAEKNRIDEQAAGLMKAYAAASWEAVDATLAAIDLNYRQNKAVRDYHEQVRETTKILKDQDSSQEQRNQALDDLGSSALAAADALVQLKTQEALLSGETLSAAEKTQILIDSLKERKREASTKEERAEIQGLIDKLKEAQEVAGQGIEADATLNTDSFYADLEKVKTTIVKTEPIKIPITPQFTKQERLQTEGDPTIAGIMGKVEPVKVPLVVTGEEAAKATLASISKPRETIFNLTTRGAGSVESILDKLDNDRETIFFVTTKGAGNVESIFNRLDDSRDVYFRVHVTGADAARAVLDSVAPVNMGALSAAPTASTMTVNNVSQSFSINVPGAGSPAITAREVDRYIRRAGDRSRVSVTA